MATPKKFEKGDRVRVITERHGGNQFHGVGRIYDTPTRGDTWYRVKFEKSSPYKGENSYEARDLEHFPVVKAAKKSKAKQTYLGNGKHSYEAVTDGTYRLRVPGGWIYETRVGHVGGGSTVFVPMAEVAGHVI